MAARRSLALTALMALFAAGTHAQSPLKDAGITEAQAQEAVMTWFADGYLPVHLVSKAYRAAPAANKAAMLKGLLSWARVYSQSRAFRAEYDRRREADKPTPPGTKGGVDDQLAAQRAEQRKSIADMKANLSKMPPEMRKEMEETIKQIEAQTAEMEKDPQMTALMRQGLEAQGADERQAYEGRVAAHNKRFPADPNELIARRLTEFLEESKGVDFNAKLVPGPGGKMLFASPEYEAKPPSWKLYYRAGEAPILAMRESAAEWVKILGRR